MSCSLCVSQIKRLTKTAFTSSPSDLLAGGNISPTPSNYTLPLRAAPSAVDRVKKKKAQPTRKIQFLSPFFFPLPWAITGGRCVSCFKTVEGGGRERRRSSRRSISSKSAPMVVSAAGLRHPRLHPSETESKGPENIDHLPCQRKGFEVEPNENQVKAWN